MEPKATYMNTLDIDAIEEGYTCLDDDPDHEHRVDSCGHDEGVIEACRELRKLREENARLGETVEAFQEASGLCVPAEENGGDPGGVQPRHVEEHVHALAKRVEELETLLGDAGDAEATFRAFLLTAHALYPSSHPDYYREQSKVAEARCAVWSEQRRIATRRAERAS